MNTETTWYANIWIAGDYASALDACREFTLFDKTCVTVTKTDYVYTGGMESGVCVRMIQYPRFPTPVEKLEAQTRRLALVLRARLCQESFLIEFPNYTTWDSTRDSDQPELNLEESDE